MLTMATSSLHCIGLWKGHYPELHTKDLTTSKVVIISALLLDAVQIRQLFAEEERQEAEHVHN